MFYDLNLEEMMKNRQIYDKFMLNCFEICDCILILICNYSVFQSWMYIHGFLDKRSFYFGPLSWLILFPIRTVFYAFKEEVTIRERVIYIINLIFQIMAFTLFFILFRSPYVIFT